MNNNLEPFVTCIMSDEIDVANSQTNDKEMTIDLPNGRNQVEGKEGFFEGTSGFTVDIDAGVISANCNAIK